MNTHTIPTVMAGRGAALIRSTAVPVTTGLWRVTTSSGAVLGHVQSTSDPRGERFAARRASSIPGTTIELGLFWSIDDALACFDHG
ncbi:hypothetical protein [Compostimonas suwonensis]|uniref:Uncharacterized protein n=1 Tax=Compostimonas suwonensis TaxID=1048394 RepID=A0A2M9BZL0_9MICO|nr:hypothetical protein [Compostimonas suwonensis]PJJ63514.1 hypothetical protein CLV54_1182 [Compostimonas suwonensis]